MDVRKKESQEHEMLASVCFDLCWARIFPWVKRIRMASAEEDARGMDVVVETADVGDVPIQVKSSKKFLKKHFRRYPDIPVLIINREHTEEEIRKSLSRIIRREREKRVPGYDRTKEGLQPREAAAGADPLRVSLADIVRRR